MSHLKRPSRGKQRSAYMNRRRAAIMAGEFVPMRRRGRPRVEKLPTPYQLAARELHKKFPTLSSLPPIFDVDLIANQIDHRDPMRRRSMAARFLKNLDASRLGSHMRGSRHYRLWASADVSRFKAMTRRERLLLVLGPEAREYPPQNIPHGLASWREVYRAVSQCAAHRGYRGKPSGVWRWGGPRHAPREGPRITPPTLP